MSPNGSSSTKTSFNPLAQYNILTRLMAKKNNLKVNRNLIPGIDRITQPPKSIQKFSRQNIQNKFIARYANCEPKSKVNSRETAATKTQSRNQSAGSSSQAKSELLQFEFKKPAENQMKFKVKSKQPTSFSNPIVVDPDNFLFKKPAAPPVNKFRNPFTQQQPQNNRKTEAPFKGRVSYFEQPRNKQMQTFVDHAGISDELRNNNTTFDTITSVQFKPPGASTPFEVEKVGMFVDPENIDPKNVSIE